MFKVKVLDDTEPSINRIGVRLRFATPANHSTHHEQPARLAKEKMESDEKDQVKEPAPFPYMRGSDPRVATCRGKLQSKRCKLNQEINKELRLRAGAENLFKATTNKKLKDTVALELSFVNSNLQLLKEQLSELNSSVEIYQSEGLDYVIPMIPLGLKETKEVNFMEPFSDFILEHYSEPSHIYEDAIADITDTRQAAKTPTRDAQGVSLLFRYYNLLYYVERRFFPPDRSLGVYFEWYDSLTGRWGKRKTVPVEWERWLFEGKVTHGGYKWLMFPPLPRCLQAYPRASVRLRSRRRAYCSIWPRSTPRSVHGRTVRRRRVWMRR